MKEAQDKLSFEEVALYSQEIDLDELSTLEIYAQRRYPDALFMGCLIRGRRQGKGLMKYANGRQYEGEWENDTRNG